MSIKRSVLLGIIISIYIIFFSNIGFSATCGGDPSRISVYSGNTFVGNYLNGDTVNVKSDFSTNPIKLEFYFIDVFESCINSVKMQFYSGGPQYTFTDIEKTYVDGKPTTIARFEYSTNAPSTDSFTGTYEVSTSYETSVGTLSFTKTSNPTPSPSPDGGGTCKGIADYIKVYSGGDYVGEYLDGDLAYMRRDLGEYPLKIELFFENVPNSCISTVDDVKVKFLPSGGSTSVDSVDYIQTESYNITKATAQLSIEGLVINNQFTTNYYVPSVGGTGSISFSFDESNPIFTSFSAMPNDIVGTGTNATVSFSINDLDSGLKNVVISGQYSDNIDLNGVSSYSDEFSFELNGNSDITITAYDMFDNSVTRNVSFFVDSTKPQFGELDKVYIFDGKRKVNIDIDVLDDSFEDGYSPTVYANFSEFSPTLSNVEASCSKNVGEGYNCRWSGIPVNFNETKSVGFKISASDYVGNTNEKSFTEEFFVDFDGPQIKSFYVVNSMNNTNIFSASDDDVKVILEFTDDSLEYGDPQIREDFGKLQFGYKECNNDNNTVKCVWDIGESVGVYSDVKYNNDKFLVEITDFYGNSQLGSINVTIDNTIPKLSDITIIETEDIKDDLVKSGEVINFRVFVEDDSILTTDHEIVGDFSNINYDEGFDKVYAECANYNHSEIQCDFNNIKVVNGYLKKNISVTAYDLAGNSNTVSTSVEIFKVSDEVVSSYRISDITTMNPLNRNLMKTAGGVAWFEGTIESMNNNMVIINYVLLGCSEKDLDPILINEYGLYPEETVINNGQENIEDFAIRADLKDHSNMADLNTKTMTCNMSIYKRDSESIYPPEYVNFKLKFGFYDTPRGGITSAHAEKVLEYIEEAEFLGSWFDDIYSIYAIFRDLCGLINGAGGLVNQVVEIYQIIQILTDPECIASTGNSCTDAVKAAVESTKDGIMGFLTDPDSFIKKACDYVTCSNGATIMGALTDTVGQGNDGTLGEIPGLNYLVEAKDFLGGAMCGVEDIGGILGDSEPETANVGDDLTGVTYPIPVVEVSSLPPPSNQ